MATVIRTQRGRLDEHGFFLGMAGLIAATVVVGFAMSAHRLGGSAFGALPFLVHVHAGVFLAWIVLYVVQSSLVSAGSLALHRRLGVAGAVIATTMVILGTATTIMCVRRGAVPPFFPPSVLLVVDIIGVIVFGGLTAAAILLRRKSGWHKRLMLCGTIMVMSPALGRILPIPQLGSLAPLAVFAAMMAYVLTGVAFDQYHRGRVHIAYAWGGGVIILSQLSVGPLAFSGPVLRLTAAIQS
jgi:hypothetical protein